MKLIGIVFLLFVSLSGMAQQAETLKEYVTKRWEDFKVPEKEAAKAVLGKYSWEKTAGELVKLFDRYAG